MNNKNKKTSKNFKKKYSKRKYSKRKYSKRKYYKKKYNISKRSKNKIVSKKNLKKIVGGSNWQTPHLRTSSWEVYGRMSPATTPPTRRNQLEEIKSTYTIEELHNKFKPPINEKDIVELVQKMNEKAVTTPSPQSQFSKKHKESELEPEPERAETYSSLTLSPRQGASDQPASQQLKEISKFISLLNNLDIGKSSSGEITFEQFVFIMRRFDHEFYESIRKLKEDLEKDDTTYDIKLYNYFKKLYETKCKLKTGEADTKTKNLLDLGFIEKISGQPREGASDYPPSTTYAAPRTSRSRTARERVARQDRPRGASSLEQGARLSDLLDAQDMDEILFYIYVKYELDKYDTENTSNELNKELSKIMVKIPPGVINAALDAIMKDEKSQKELKKLAEILKIPESKMHIIYDEVHIIIGRTYKIQNTKNITIRKHTDSDDITYIINDEIKIEEIGDRWIKVSGKSSGKNVIGYMDYNDIKNLKIEKEASVGVTYGRNGSDLVKSNQPSPSPVTPAGVTGEGEDKGVRSYQRVGSSRTQDSSRTRDPTTSRRGP